MLRRTCRNPHSAIRVRRLGFTMPELLVTMSIVAFLLLAGVGVYWRMSRGFALRAAVSSVESAMRGARAFAIHERSHTVVVLEPLPADTTQPFLIENLSALGKRTVSCWHFESSQLSGTELTGALGQTGGVTGTATTASGKIGRSLTFDGAADAVSVRTPYLDEIRDGVFIEAYVWPDPEGLSDGAELPIVSKAADGTSAYTLALRYKPTGTQDLFWLEGSVHTESATPSAHTDALIRAKEWTHVALAYMRDATDEDGADLGVVLRINGQEVALAVTATASDALTPNVAPMLIGKRGGAYFRGRLDELKIGSLVAGEEFRLPKNAEVRADPGSSDGHVHFDEEGKLDPRRHSHIARFTVVLPRDKLRRTIQVNWLGAVEVLEREREVDEDEAEE